MEVETELGYSTEKPLFNLLDSSRLLEKDKSFQEQDIVQNAEIICLISKHELKTRFYNDTKEEILHDISELLGFEAEQKTENPNKEARKKRQRYHK